MRAALSAMVVLTVGAMIGAGAAAAEPAPSAEQLQAQLQKVLNRSLPDAERAAELQGGLAAVPTANNIAGVMDQYSSMMSWRVQNASQRGDQVDAQLAVTIPIFGTKTHDIYWVNSDGAWKLSNPSACVIARDAAGVDCTV
ncbi:MULTISPECIES: hypothetical protein [Mycolicibacterium]|jgi:hypothetical protein|uniref:Low molecular weight antigen MTB12-like C-terminal domain-containing protein n=2 Tax=Mycolicibacterium TaxID=1866885 RepID=A0A378TD65_9MYCO|nr:MULTISPECIES: hypothetical protein [Mycolicibacterium]ANW67572.1 hypothetical protein BCA37_09015 [Mycobacterium sp. djl-10]MCV7181491.1 hypothetical protein [Mycolicibacterium murale]STZ57815.1 Uncharacterised protein [Mycolicibacterium tokaiense]BBY87662.1 hypothetical protein MTOK_34440 [Mycolicibacterium tokaiense]GFG61060.1 hypothetical protein MMUR_51960 [Mycolicibacterium murale]